MFLDIRDMEDGKEAIVIFYEVYNNIYIIIQGNSWYGTMMGVIDTFCEIEMNII